MELNLTARRRQSSRNIQVPVLIVGSDHEAALERYYFRYLNEAGIKNHIFPAQTIFYDYYNRSLLNKVLYKIGLARIYKHINKELIRSVDELNPKVLLVFKGMEIFPKTLSKLKARGIKLINYNPDNPFLFSGSGSGNDHVTDAIPLYDLHLTYDRDIMQTMNLLNLKVAWIPFGFDLSNEEVELCSREKEVNKICFLGFPDELRSKFLNEIAASGLSIDVYGGKWNRYRLHQNITVYNPVYRLDFWKVLRKYRVQLNLMRPHNPDSHNMRSFEVPAVGGIGLFPDTPDHQDFFEDRKEVFLFNDVEECIALAKELMAMSKEEALSIRNRARRRSIDSNYSYQHRTKRLIELINTLTV